MWDDRCHKKYEQVIGFPGRMLPALMHIKPVMSCQVHSQTNYLPTAN